MSLDQFFQIIKDGAWHNIEELSDQLGIKIGKLKELSKFLCDHNLLRYDDETQRIKIKPIWKLLLPEQEEPTEPKTTLVNFILPPETSIEVQSTRISNISNIEVEVSLRMDNKIKEVAIKV